METLKPYFMESEMLRLSTLFLFLSSLLVAQTDIIVRKVLIRDVADSKFWELAQDPADLFGSFSSFTPSL